MTTEEPILCTGAGTGCACANCQALRDAAAAGARPKNVPIRVYGAYREARAAFRANAYTLANQTLEWLIGHLAEERGARADQTLKEKLERLRAQGVILPRLPQSLIEEALASNDTPERAWALLSIVEHVFHRLYL
jgi:hypothetical protein